MRVTFDRGVCYVMFNITNIVVTRPPYLTHSCAIPQPRTNIIRPIPGKNVRHCSPEYQKGGGGAVGSAHSKKINALADKLVTSFIAIYFQTAKFSFILDFGKTQYLYLLKI